MLALLPVGLLLGGCPVITPAEHASRVDADGDGHFAIGYEDGDDCDDNSAEAYPGLDEVCDDGLDNDCDGTSNPCGLAGDQTLTTADLLLIGESNGDKAGQALANVGDIDGNGTEDVLIGLPGYDDGPSNTGAAYLVLGPLDDTGRFDLGQSDMRLYGTDESEQAGLAVAGPGDLDGDGYRDMAVGSPLYSTADDSKLGAFYVVFGPGGSSRSLSASDATGTGQKAYDELGFAMTGGAFGGDAERDLAVSAPYRSSGGSRAGVVYLLHGPVEGTKAMSKAEATLSGDAGDEAGTALHAGDINGDGVDDLFIGAPGYSGRSDAAGTAFAVYGPIEGDLTLTTDADAEITGFSQDSGAGGAIRLADMDGDGYLDGVVGAPGAAGRATGSGVVYIAEGPVIGRTEVTASLLGQSTGDGVGVSLDVGDTDGDGVLDVLAGAPYRYGSALGSGVTFLVYGPVEGSVGLGRADARLLGESEDDNSGYAVAVADLDGSGTADVLVGAYGQDTVHNNGGIIYLFMMQGI